MSDAPAKLTLPALGDMKRRAERLTSVTAYDYPSARLADEAGIDIVLVGDSAAMTVLGYDTTLPISMDEMLTFTRAVVRAVRRAVVVADMPFGSFQVSDESAVANAVRFAREAGADAVKIEGAGPSLARARAIVEAGIPVMGHLGLTPQSVTKLGGYRAQARTADAATAAGSRGRADHRHRRRPVLRWASAGVARPARTDERPPGEVRQAVRRARPDDRRRASRLHRRRQRRALSGRRAHLPHARRGTQETGSREEDVGAFDG